MADKLMYIPNDAAQNYQLLKLQFVVETYGHLTNQSKFNKSPPKLKI